MATTSKSEKIFIGVGSEVIELTGTTKEVFLEQRKADNVELDLAIKKNEEQKQLKIDAYTKLGLTEEEIKTIL